MTLGVQGWTRLVLKVWLSPLPGDRSLASPERKLLSSRKVGL